MKNIIKRLIPTPIIGKAINASRVFENRRRRKEVACFPEAHLEEKHIRNCQLVLNRRRMLELIGKQNIVAELGVNKGEFSKAILEITKPDKLHLVDCWDSQGLYRQVSEAFSPEINSELVQIHHKLSTDASRDFEDNYFNMVYIDTDHTYQTTRDELLAYAPKMKQGGIIAGHDYSMGNWIYSYRYGVIEAVHEFCINHDWKFCYLTAEPLERCSFAIRKI